MIVNIRFDAGKTPLSAIHSTVCGKSVVTDGINHILLLSGGTRKRKNVRLIIVRTVFSLDELIHFTSRIINVNIDKFFMLHFTIIRRY